MLFISKRLKIYRIVNLSSSFSEFCRNKVVSHRSSSSSSSASSKETGTRTSGGLLAFLDQNLQQIANAFGIFAFISCCNYNLKIKHAWDQKDVEEKKYNKEIEDISQKLLLDPAWTVEVEKKIRSSTEIGILQAEITKKIAFDESK